MSNGEDRAILTGNGVFFGEYDMGAVTTVRYSHIEVGRISMFIQDHVAGAIENAVIGISHKIVKQFRDGFISSFGGGCLLGTDIYECNKELVVNRTRI